MKAITARLTLIGASVGIIALLAPGPATAQILPQSSPGIGQNNSTDLDFLDKPDGASSSSLLNLVNRVRMLQNYNAEQFTAEQSGSLDVAAAQFRARQLQQIQKMQPQSINSTLKVNPAPVP